MHMMLASLGPAHDHAGGHSRHRLEQESPSLAGVRGVLFDMGDVLYDATVWRRWLAQLLGHLGMPADYCQLFRLWDAAFLEDVHRGLRDYDEAFRAFLAELGLSHGQVDEVVAASAARRRELADSLRPLPGVRSGVRRLHAAGYCLGVLSDSEAPASRLRDRLTLLGLNECFAVVLSSVELGRTKPDPLCYQAGLSALGLPAGETAFVGHDALELQGAARLGMRTIAFNYEPAAIADAYLTRFEDLPCLFGPRCLAAAG
jgi:HAD superfamily hydrolase (TIGR01509 family)